MAEQISTRIFTIPNIITMFRILLLAPFSFFLWHNNWPLVAILAVIGFFSDYLDGIFARKLNQISKLGKILDPLADKLTFACVLIILYMKHELPLWLVLIVVGRDVTIIVGGILYHRKHKVVVTSNLIGKMTANVVALMLVSYIFNIVTLERIFTVLTVIFMIISSLSYFLKYLKLRKPNGKLLVEP